MQRVKFTFTLEKHQVGLFIALAVEASDYSVCLHSFRVHSLEGAFSCHGRA